MADYTIDAVEDAVKLLFLVAQAPGLGVTELSVRAGNTKARTFRMLRTLEKHGLVMRDTRTPLYTLGHHALYLGLAAGSQALLALAAGRVMQQLGMVYGESVQLRIRDGQESLCIARWEHPQHPRLGPRRVGIRRPLHAGAAGKVLLAYAPPHVQEAVMEHTRISFTQATLVSKSSLRHALAKIQGIGYGLSYGEVVPGAVAVAAPVRDGSREVVAVLSVAGPESRITGARMTAVIEAAMMAARDLSEQIGFR
ncbi:IclR family transcriptional regulator [Herbaspirillum chlorophenolicum]|jgi:DNA-binding IclR family transcriptional regulator|uniref:IclR family transcriptional regulator n=1 Tax=Herbaspirillum chlorophenolicum TaxID=211589 RepID=UPI0009E4EA9D|nr:IclR family transcriptional regulator [Herbaspirillum chlorophenolicum]